MFKKLKELNTKVYKNNFIELILIYLLIFIIGCIIGYVYEELFVYFTEDEIVNRGFLYGPYLPVYGFGACLITLLLKRYKKYPVFFFFSCVILTGVVEYITGAALMDIYHKRWWDYTGLFLNLQGYVCLRSVLTFAIGGLLLVYIVEPYIRSIVNKKYKKGITIYAGIFILIMILDFIITISIRHL